MTTVMQKTCFDISKFLTITMVLLAAQIAVGDVWRSGAQLSTSFMRDIFNLVIASLLLKIMNSDPQTQLPPTKDCDLNVHENLLTSDHVKKSPLKRPRKPRRIQELATKSPTAVQCDIALNDQGVLATNVALDTGSYTEQVGEFLHRERIRFPTMLKNVRHKRNRVMPISELALREEHEPLTRNGPSSSRVRGTGPVTGSCTCSGIMNWQLNEGRSPLFTQEQSL